MRIDRRTFSVGAGTLAKGGSGGVAPPPGATAVLPYILAAAVPVAPLLRLAAAVADRNSAGVALLAAAAAAVEAAPVTIVGSLLISCLWGNSSWAGRRGASCVRASGRGAMTIGGKKVQGALIGERKGGNVIAVTHFADTGWYHDSTSSSLWSLLLPHCQILLHFNPH